MAISSEIRTNDGKIYKKLLGREEREHKFSIITSIMGPLISSPLANRPGVVRTLIHSNVTNS